MPDREKEERKKKQQASLASTLTKEALAMQRTIDKRLGVAGLLNQRNEKDIMPVHIAGAERCMLCMKFAPNVVRKCPGQDGELLCVYFESNGAMKPTSCARCVRNKGSHAQRCKGGRRGESKCQYYMISGQPKKNKAFTWC